MPPERKIEKLLRAFGHQRREQAKQPFALHPANRRTLQAEVRKLARLNQNAPKANLWWWIKRMLFATGAFAVVLVLVMILPAFDPTRKTKERTSTFDVASAPNQSLENAQQVKQEPAFLKDKKEVLVLSGASGRREDLDQATDGEPALQRRPELKPQFPAASSAVAASRASTMFQQVAVPAEQSPVLLRFTVESTRSGVRVVDADGSVYKSVRDEQVRATSEAFPTRAAESQSRLDAEPISSQAFAVSGTNLTLNQMIVFEGSLHFFTNSSNPLSLGNASRANGTTVPTELRGTVRINGATFTIEAQPVTPEGDK